MCLESNYTIVCCWFELLLFSIVLCYALWHNQYSAEGVMEFICCNQTLGFFLIIIIHIHGVQAPGLALHFLKAIQRPSVASPWHQLPLSAEKGPSSSSDQGDHYYLGMACTNH